MNIDNAQEQEIIKILSNLAPMDYERIEQQVRHNRKKWSVSGTLMPGYYNFRKKKS